MKAWALTAAGAGIVVVATLATCVHRGKSGGSAPASSESAPAAPGATASSTASAAAESEGDPGMSNAKGCPEALEQTRLGGADPDRYVAPSDAERDAIRDAVARALASGKSGDDVAAAAKRAGFEIAAIPDMDGAVLLRESASRRRGGGAYVIRPASKSTLIIEAPHTFYDQGTLPLSCELFSRSGARALFINTSHRYKSAPPDVKGDHPADVAHSPRSLFQAANEGVLKSIPKATVVQLHGFAARGSDTLVVLSAGDRTPGDPLVTRAAEALTAVLKDGVRTYPDTAGELGATTNVQGTLVRSSGGRFLHVEMASHLRKQLLDDDALRARFLGAIATAAGRAP